MRSARLSGLETQAIDLEDAQLAMPRASVMCSSQMEQGQAIRAVQRLAW